MIWRQNRIGNKDESAVMLVCMCRERGPQMGYIPDFVDLGATSEAPSRRSRAIAELNLITKPRMAAHTLSSPRPAILFIVAPFSHGHQSVQSVSQRTILDVSDVNGRGLAQVATFKSLDVAMYIGRGNGGQGISSTADKTNPKFKHTRVQSWYDLIGPCCHRLPTTCGGRMCRACRQIYARCVRTRVR